MASPARTPNHSPIHIAAMRKEQTVISTANINRDGSTGTYVEIFAAGEAGSRVARVDVKATGTTTAGMVRIFREISSTKRLVGEIAVTAITPSATVLTFEGNWVAPGIDGELLQDGQKLFASTHNAEEFVVSVTGGDY